MSATSLAEGFGRNLSSSYGSSGSMLSGTKEFLGSNSAIAKLAFLFLVLIAFTTILRVGTQLLAWLFTPSGSPILLNGMLPSRNSKDISTDPSKSNSIPILRSKNENGGVEFTYSVWVKVNSLSAINADGTGSSGSNQLYKHIFHKGNAGFNDKGINAPNNAPGLYLDSTKNALVVFMDTFESIGEKIEIDNIPFNKWINVIIRVSGKNVDVYVNGTLVRRHILKDVPKQNYGDIFIHKNVAYDGETSSLRYFNYALTISEISGIVETGPNLTADESLFVFPPYFSMNWYLNQ